MEEFGLTIVEVKNKIRIYRTTYGQEVKKMEGNGASPKLNWFSDMHRAFTQGKIKSFTKSPSVRAKAEQKPKKAKMVEVEYEIENENDQEMSEKSSQEMNHQIIIEQYQEDDDFSDPLLEEIDALESMESPDKKFKTETRTPVITQTTPGTSTGASSGMMSNGLFLKSLQSTLDSLPDQKNMRARIKIQEVLYKIAFDD